jgi:hypothetical protein
MILKKKKIVFYLVKMKLQYMLFFKKKVFFCFLIFYKAEKKEKNDLTKRLTTRRCNFCLSQTKRKSTQTNLREKKNNMIKCCFFFFISFMHNQRLYEMVNEYHVEYTLDKMFAEHMDSFVLYDDYLMMMLVH